MRRNDKAITDQTIIEDLLINAPVCRIGFADEGVPYIVPVNYAYLSNALYIHSSKEGKKIELAKKNNFVCFEIEDNSEVIQSSDKPCDISTKYRSIIGHGTLLIIDDNDEKKSALDIIVKKFSHTSNLSYSSDILERIVILKLCITELTGKQSGKWCV